MSISGKSPSSDKRHRPTRVTPRRHGDSSDQATYDSSDFPVLLRMPDVSRPTATNNEQVSTSERPEQAMAPEPASAEKPGDAGVRRKSRHSRPSVGSESAPDKTPTRDKNPTGSSAARFWSTIPPQVAAGGMLLAVIALCFVLLHDTKSNQVLDTKPDWDTSKGPQVVLDTPPVEATNAVPSAPQMKGSESSSQNSASIALKPTAPKFTSSVPIQPEVRTNEAVQDASVSGWPTDLQSSAASGDDVTPIEGWPDESGAEMQLNGPLESASRPMASSLRTSQRPIRTDSSTSGFGPTEAARFDGTIEIPPPTKMYRK